VLPTLADRLAGVGAITPRVASRLDVLVEPPVVGSVHIGHIPVLVGTWGDRRGFVRRASSQVNRIAR